MDGHLESRLPSNVMAVMEDEMEPQAPAALVQEALGRALARDLTDEEVEWLASDGS